MYYIPDPILEIIFVAVFLLLGYQAILDITTTKKLIKRVRRLEREVYLLKKELG